MFAQTLTLLAERPTRGPSVRRTFEHVDYARNESGLPLCRVVEERRDLFVFIAAGAPQRCCEA